MIKKSKEIAKDLEKEMQCKCDFDRWKPEKTIGHSWVCDIHQVALSRYRDAAKGE